MARRKMATLVHCLSAEDGTAAAAEPRVGAAVAAAAASSAAGAQDAPGSGSSSSGSSFAGELPGAASNGGGAHGGGGNGGGGDARAPPRPQQRQARLVLASGAAMLPHPDKVAKGGEDAYFICDSHNVMGVADGVGGWAEVGVDAGAYARQLMSHAAEETLAAVAARGSGSGSISPQDVLERAFYRTNVQGSATACIMALNDATLFASNLGDSGFVLVRGGAPTFQSPQQQHNFNFPYQLGSADSMSDQPQAAMRFELAVQPGDIVVAGSDGLWDNVFADEAATVVSRCRDGGESAATAAEILCRYARMRASDAKHHSPFSYSAIAAGYVYLGGKMDDITVLVAYVGLAPRL